MASKVWGLDQFYSTRPEFLPVDLTPNLTQEQLGSWVPRGTGGGTERSLLGG